MEQERIICSTDKSCRGQFIPWIHQFKNWDIVGILKLPNEKMRVLVLQDSQGDELQRAPLKNVLVDFDLVEETSSYRIIKVKSFIHFDDRDGYSDLTCNPWS